MADITDSTFQNYADDLVKLSDRLVYDILRLQAGYARKVAKNPGAALRLQREISARYDELVSVWQKQATEEMRHILPKAYLRGIQQMNSQAKMLGAGGPEYDLPISQRFAPTGVSITPPSGPALQLLEKYPRHLTLYQVFEAAAERDIADMRLPIIRSSSDVLRAIAIESGTVEYKEANEFTRRLMSQDILDRFADRSVAGKIDTGGRRWRLDSYAELIARTQTGNAARQAHMNRQQQYGLDLVRISSHSPCSDLCRPWQGRVFSMSGKSEQYPPLSDATSGGLYHPNCKHSQSAYVPGVSEKLDNPGQFADDSKRDARAYELDQQQRYNERMIRKWKRRQAVAVTPEAKKQAADKIRAWQQRQRQLIRGNESFLRRKYHRESIEATGRRTG